jgi:type I restriction enzyme S subunit
MFGDPVTNPKGWEIKKLEEVTTKITDGVHSRPNYTEQGVPFISVKDITTGELKFDDCKFISEEDHKKYKKRCNPDMGDILYTKVGATYGRPALVNVKSEFSLYVSVCLIKPQRDLIFPEFLKEALATPALKSQADRSIKGIGVPDLHLNMIKDFIVPVPPIYKQKEFLERISYWKLIDIISDKMLVIYLYILKSAFYELAVFNNEDILHINQDVIKMKQISTTTKKKNTKKNFKTDTSKHTNI